MSTLLTIENVTKRFDHDGLSLQVLSQVNLKVEAGEILCLVGPSGAGKSTLLHILGTLDRPSEGHVRYREKDVFEFSASQLAEFRNRNIGFVFQFHHLLPEFTAIENVMMPGSIAGLPRQELRERSRQLLEEVGLSHRLSHRPSELSGGEQQRVALARALAMKPSLVLADEPTGNLDSNTGTTIHDLIFELNARHGTTFLVVTHSGELARRMPRTVSMRDGRIVSDRSTPLDAAEDFHQETASL